MRLISSTRHGGRCVELAVLVICLSILSQPGLSDWGDGKIMITTPSNRVMRPDLCTNWSTYWDVYESSCYLCMFARNENSRPQQGCMSERLGEAQYEEINPTIPANNDSVARCDITPLLRPGVRATCSVNTFLYKGMDLPTAHPGALCHFTCASGYEPAGGNVTYIECSRCTVKGVFCSWNTTLDETLCKPVVGISATAAPLINVEARNAFIALGTIVLMISIFITVISQRCRCCRKNARPENECSSESGHDEELANQRDPLFAGANDSVGPEAEKSVGSSESSESGYSSNTDRACEAAASSHPGHNVQNIQNINNFYHHVNIGVTGDVHMVAIDQSLRPVTDKPSPVELALASQTAISMDHHGMAGDTELVQVHVSQSQTDSINSTPVCDHQLGADGMAEEPAISSAKKKLSLPCSDAAGDDVELLEESDSTIAPLPVALPKQKVLSGRVQSTCLTADSGIATANTDNLRTIEDLSIRLPTSPLSDLTQQEDVIQLPAENLDSLQSSADQHRANAEDGAGVSSVHTLVGEPLCPEEERRYETTTNTNGTSEDTLARTKQHGVRQNLLENATSLDLVIPSMDSTSLRRHPAGNSDDLPAPDAGPCSLVLDELPPSDDSLMFSTLNSSSTEMPSRDSSGESSYPRLHLLDSEKEITGSSIGLVGPESNPNETPHSLTENPPHPDFAEADFYNGYPIWPPVHDPRLPYPPQGYFYYPADPRANVRCRYSSPPPYAPNVGFAAQERSYAPTNPSQSLYPRPPQAGLPRQSPSVIHNQNIRQLQPHLQFSPHPQHPLNQQVLPPQQPQLNMPSRTQGSQRPQQEPHNQEPPPQQSPPQQSPQQEYAPIPPGELILKAKHVGEFVMKKERIIGEGNSERAHSLIRQTSLFPQSGAVRVEADKIDKCYTTTTDKIHSKETCPAAGQSGHS